jgi:hypothetical protein
MRRIAATLVYAITIVLLIYSFGFSERGIKIKESRLALVIGNGDYKKALLKNPVNDAYDMAKALREMGFEVIHKENASQRSMENAIRYFGKRLRKGGVGLFYFAGHGIQVKGINYLIPVDASIESESDVKYECVDAGRVLGKMEDAGNHLNIVVLDACRDNPFERSFRSSSGGLARMDAPKGSLIAYATAPGSVAAEGIGRNGVYTKHLLKHMQIPGLAVEQVLKRTRIEVMNETGDKQVPWESSSLRGNFYFVHEGKITATKVPAKKESTELEKEREQLERQRKKVERLKMEIERKKLEAEQKRLEAEKKKLKTAKIKELEAKHKAAEEKARKEAAEKKAIEEKRKRLEAEKQKSEMAMAKLPLQHKYTGLKLAVLPSKLSDYSGFAGVEGIEKVLLKALDGVFKETKLFIPLFSYYNLKNDDTKIIDEKIIGKNILDNIWVKKSIFSNFEPNIHMLSTLGEQLKVDAVLTYCISVNHGPDYIDVFLIDVKNRKVYDENGTTAHFFTAEEGLPKIIGLTEKVFSDYKSEQK